MWYNWCGSSDTAVFKANKRTMHILFIPQWKRLIPQHNDTGGFANSGREYLYSGSRKHHRQIYAHNTNLKAR